MTSESLISVENVTIAASGSLSGGANLNGRDNAPAGLRVCGIVMPAAWTAASMTFEVSMDGVTYQDLYDADGNEMTFTVAAATTLTLDPAIFAAMPYVKVRSGVSATPVNQAAERTVGLVLRRV